MNPHARSATARCWSPPAGEGVLLVLSLARAGTEVLLCRGLEDTMLFVFGDL